MHQMAVDIDQAGAVRLLVHQMVVPDLVVEGARLRHRRSLQILGNYLAPPGVKQKGPNGGPFMHSGMAPYGLSLGGGLGRLFWQWS